MLALRMGVRRRIYLLRTVASALAFLMVASVLYPLDAPWPLWIGPLLHCFLWPQLAWWLSRRAPRPGKAERRNLLLDHLLSGIWVPLIGFNLLISAVALAILSMESIARGGRQLLWRGLLGYLVGAGVGVVLFGLHWQPRPSLLTVLACLPFLLLVTVALSYATRDVVQQLLQTRAELELRTWHDGLSGLFNRSHWEETVRAEFKRCRQSGETATLVLADLDFFKRINDLHGHLVGDQVIRNFADLLRQSVRETDVPGRYGGEEFGILLPHTRSAEAAGVIARMRERLHDAPLLENSPVTASFGIVELSADIDSSDHWIRLADQMLYSAKYNGRDCAVEYGLHDAATHDDRRVLQPAMSARNPAILHLLLQGLDVSDAPIAMFDPGDRLVMANSAYLKLYQPPPGVDTFEGIIRSLHMRRAGPIIDADTPEQWLAVFSPRRRRQTRYSYLVETHEGQQFRCVENCFNGGWILVALMAAE